MCSAMQQEDVVEHERGVALRQKICSVCKCSRAIIPYFVDGLLLAGVIPHAFAFAVKFRAPSA